MLHARHRSVAPVAIFLGMAHRESGAPPLELFILFCSAERSSVRYSWYVPTVMTVNIVYAKLAKTLDRSAIALKTKYQ
jgi:hypothetical protein